MLNLVAKLNETECSKLSVFLVKSDKKTSDNLALLSFDYEEVYLFEEFNTKLQYHIICQRPIMLPETTTVPPRVPTKSSVIVGILEEIAITIIIFVALVFPDSSVRVSSFNLLICLKEFKVNQYFELNKKM